MAERQILLSAIPFQIVNAMVNGQSYRITVRQNGGKIYTSLMVDGVQVTDNVMAREGAPIVPFSQTTARTIPYWVDLQGREPPQYEGLGSRWLLCYEAE